MLRCYCCTPGTHVRYSDFAVWFCGLIVWASGTYLAAQPPLPFSQPPPPPQPSSAAAEDAASEKVSAISRFFYTLHGLPGFPGLQWDHVQDTLGLTPDQRQQLAHLGHQYYEAQQRDWKAQLLPRPGREEPDPAERMRQDTALAQRWRERLTTLEQQVKAVLSPEQLEQWRKLERRRQLAAWLFEVVHPAALPLEPHQRQWLVQWQQETQRRCAEAAFAIQQEAAQQLQKALTPEQWQKLHALTERAFAEESPR